MGLEKPQRSSPPLSPTGRTPISTVAWSPDSPTQLLTSSEDDAHPTINCWDLRNARAPERILSGHSEGVLNLAWCPKDAEMLVSTGKDSRTMFWNPLTGALLGQLPARSNWTFEAQWCPRNPDLFYTASFDGAIQVYSLQSISALLESRPTPAGNLNISANAADVTSPSSKQVPKWLRRPIGATFGFGGRLVMFSNQQSRSPLVSVLTVKAAGTQSTKLFEQATKLETAISGRMQADFCAYKCNDQILPDGKIIWQALAALYDPTDPLKRLVESVLGLSISNLQQQQRPPESSQSHKSSTRSPVEDAFSGVDNGEFDDFSSAIQLTQSSHHSSQQPLVQSPPRSQTLRRQSTFEAIPFELYSPDADDDERAIMKAIVLGDYKLAVDLCVQSGRMSDALLVAICGGDELVNDTRRQYLQHHTKHPYLRIVSSIVKHDLHDIVECASLDGWKEILALLCTSSDPSLFSQHCNLLADRLSASPHHVIPAIITLLTGKNVSAASDHIVQLITSTSSIDQNQSLLASLVELLKMTEGLNQQGTSKSSSVLNVYKQWALVLVEHGLVDIAINYTGSASVDDLAQRLQSSLTVGPRAELSVATSSKAPTDRPSVQQPGSSDNLYGRRPPPPQGQPALPQLQPVPVPGGRLSGSHADNLTGSFSFAQSRQPSFDPTSLQPPITSSGTFSASAMPRPPLPPTTIPYASSPPMPPHPGMSATVPVSSGQFLPTPVSPPPMAPPSFPPQSAHPPFPSAGTYTQPPAPPQISHLPPTQSFPQSQHYPPQPPLPQRPPQQHIPPPQASPQIPHLSFPVTSNQPAAISPPPRLMMPSTTAPITPPIPSVGAPPPPPLHTMLSPPMPKVPATFPNAPSSNVPPAPPRPFSSSGSLSPTHPLPMSSSANITGYNDVPSRPLSTQSKSSLLSSQSIQGIIQSLIDQCLSRSSPMQRRIVEDSFRRIESSLYKQLSANTLSDPVLNQVSQMATLIQSHDYESAHAMHMPLMATHFSEVGPWILAVKRLLEVARTCMQQ